MRSECYTMLKSYAEKHPDRLTDATLAEVQSYYIQTQKEAGKYGSPGHSGDVSFVHKIALLS